MTRYFIEPLESRIAPATIVNHIFDITAGVGQTGATIDLGKMVDASKSFRTVVELVTNFTPQGQTDPGVIRIELFDDKAPVTVNNFLRYLNNTDKRADYDGTFFHRLVQGFVLQGGGNNVTDRQHIATFAPVHNEFDPMDTERSNVVQTVAMAKVASEQGGGPNSATSEFFINLSDNASNLDAQNGGFSVFGRVTDDSMGVVNAISALQTSNNAPVQNFSGGVPTAAQLIQIVDARVVAGEAGEADGSTFEVVSIKDSVTDADTNLITAKYNSATHALDLKYTPGMTGVAKVKVKVSKDGEMDEFDEFLVTVKPNLLADVQSDGLHSSFVPGDKGEAKIQILNNSGGLAKGKVNVKLYLSESSLNNSGDAKGFELDTEGADKDFELATLNDVSINVVPGKSTTIPVKFTVPANGLTDGKQYRLLAKVETANGSTIQELFTDDNVGNFTRDDASIASPDVLRKFALSFGSLDGRSKVPLTVQDAADKDVTFIIKGAGTGSVVKNTDGTVDVTVTATNAKSSLQVKTAKGVVAQLDDLFINDTIGAVKLGNVHLHGHLTASEGAKSIVLGDLDSTYPAQSAINLDKTISIGVFPVASQKLSLNFGKVGDYSLTSSMSISKISAKEWLNDAANTLANSIGAPGIGILKIAGDLQASVTVAGFDKVNLFSVGGSLTNATVKTNGNVGVVQLGDISGSTFLAGLAAKPTAIGDFVSAKTITNFIVKGTMSDSTVAAAKFNSVIVTAVDANAGSSPGGFYADAIKSYVRKGAVKRTNLDAPVTFDSVNPNFEAKVF